jgi:hypothetical protein
MAFIQQLYTADACASGGDPGLQHTDASRYREIGAGTSAPRDCRSHSNKGSLTSPRRKASF